MNNKQVVAVQIDVFVKIYACTLLLMCFSFTFDAWVRLPLNCCEGVLPVVCSREGILCLYVENRYSTWTRHV